MIELIDKDIKAVSVTAFHLFKKLKERLGMFGRDTEDIKETQIICLEKKMNYNVWDRIRNTEKRIVNFMTRQWKLPTENT